MTMINDFSRAKTLADVSAEFNPIVQLQKIADYGSGRHRFFGSSFNADVSPLEAVKIVSALNGLRPDQRLTINEKLVTDQEFFETVRQFVIE